MKRIIFIYLLLCFFRAQAQNLAAKEGPQVKIENGILQGSVEASGVRSYKGIPYAQPPVGPLRWKAPQKAKDWKGVRQANKFGPRAMQRTMYSDMVFRSPGVSEDCLYLNVWTPAQKTNAKLPVMVYIHGGALLAGDGSEYRYDGESMAQNGIVTVTLNYRLGVFGFFSHPELTAESPVHASGNYGLLDQHLALVWVKNNIAAFGGDPNQVTIAGESAGSMSVCAQMASPLSKGLFKGAIAESGSWLGNLSPSPLAEGEREGVKFATRIKTGLLANMRKLPADSLLKWAEGQRLPTVVDGLFITDYPQNTFATGRQMDIPLLAGWNSAEVNYKSFLGNVAPTVENYSQALEKAYGVRAEEVAKLYPATTDAEVMQTATDLASDRFIVYATWKLIDIHSKTNGYPVYRYLFTRQRPALIDQPADKAETLFGAVHASEIDYAMGNLPNNKFYNWTPEDYQTSKITQAYFVNFIKTGNPNGTGLANWYGMQSSIPKVMIIDEKAHSESEKNLKRYVLLDTFFNP
jgi:para-nitrobenzyl esterase